MNIIGITAATGWRALYQTHGQTYVMPLAHWALIDAGDGMSLVRPYVWTGEDTRDAAALAGYMRLLQPHESDQGHERAAAEAYAAEVGQKERTVQLWYPSRTTGEVTGRSFVDAKVEGDTADLDRYTLLILSKMFKSAARTLGISTGELARRVARLHLVKNGLVVTWKVEPTVLEKDAFDDVYEGLIEHVTPSPNAVPSRN